MTAVEREFSNNNINSMMTNSNSTNNSQSTTSRRSSGSESDHIMIEEYDIASSSQTHEQLDHFHQMLPPPFLTLDYDDEELANYGRIIDHSTSERMDEESQQLEQLWKSFMEERSSSHPLTLHRQQQQQPVQSIPPTHFSTSPTTTSTATGSNNRSQQQTPDYAVQYLSHQLKNTTLQNQASSPPLYNMTVPPESFLRRESRQSIGKLGMNASSGGSNTDHLNARPSNSTTSGATLNNTPIHTPIGSNSPVSIATPLSLEQTNTRHLFQQQLQQLRELQVLQQRQQQIQQQQQDINRFHNRQPLPSPLQQQQQDDWIWHQQTRQELARRRSSNQTTAGQSGTPTADMEPEVHLVEQRNIHKKRNRPYDNMMTILAPVKKPQQQ